MTKSLLTIPKKIKILLSIMDQLMSIVFFSDTENKSLGIPHRKGEEEYFFYTACYTVQFENDQKEDRCRNDEELKKDLLDSLFLQLDLIRKLILDFDFNIVKRQCFIFNQVLMNFNYFLHSQNFVRSSGV